MTESPPVKGLQQELRLPTCAKVVDWPVGARARFEARTAERLAEPSAMTEQVLATLASIPDW